MTCRHWLEGVVLAFSMIFVLGTSKGNNLPTWSTTADLTGSEVLLDDLGPDVVLAIEIELTPATATSSESVNGTLNLEVTLTWTPPATQPALQAPEIVVGLAQSSFAPEGRGRAAGIPGAEPLILQASRGALGICGLSAGCTERYRVHFLAGSLPAGSSVTATWTLTLDVEGSGRASPPPGMQVTLSEAPPP